MSQPRSLDALVAAAGLDPAAGLQVVDGDRLAAVAFDPSLPLLVVRRAAGGATGAERSLPGRHARATPVSVLRALYPHDHPIRPLPDGPPVPLAALDEARLLDGEWLVAPLPLEDNLASPHGMAAISARLRAPDGCPWDRKQTHETLRPFVLEEAYETVDAIERGTAADLAEELGDLYLQVILHAQLAAERGEFDLTDVYRTLGAKIVRRHPHVFGGLEVDGVEQVLANWETIKAGERAERSDGKRDRGPFGGVARALPALPASREIQERASALGWDWEQIGGVWEKVAEELDELRVAGATDSHQERLHELGDVLFALVNLGRWLKLDPEEALRAANRRWIDRFERVEALAAERGVDLASLDLAGKDRLWDEVKAAPRG
jgi:tetrapyrrole methylase family protein/MazG family protein